MTDPVRPVAPREDELRYCNCADPENCRETVPGYVCRKGAAAPVPCAAQSEAEPPVLKSAWVGDGTKLAARFYDYGAYEQWLRGHVCANRPEPSVPLSAIRALVQQISATLEACTIYGPADRLRDQVRQLAALCPAPPEDRK